MGLGRVDRYWALGQRGWRRCVHFGFGFGFGFKIEVGVWERGLDVNVCMLLEPVNRGIGTRCFDVKVRDARGKSMTLRAEGIGITFS